VPDHGVRRDQIREGQRRIPGRYGDTSEYLWEEYKKRWIRMVVAYSSLVQNIQAEHREVPALKKMDVDIRIIADHRVRKDYRGFRSLLV